MFCMLQKEKYILLIFQNIIQILKKKAILLMIPNREGWHYLAVKKTISIIKRNKTS